jgi:hypothetical protein
MVANIVFNLLDQLLLKQNNKIFMLNLIDSFKGLQHHLPKEV